VRPLTNGIVSGASLSLEVTGGDGGAAADLVAVGDGTAGGGGVTAAWVGVGDGAGADVEELLAATCGFGPGVISSLVK
jgi:hypothetical protein